MITIEPTSLADVVVLALYHRAKGTRLHALVGETRVPVREVQNAVDGDRRKRETALDKISADPRVYEDPA